MKKILGLSLKMKLVGLVSLIILALDIGAFFSVNLFAKDVREEKFDQKASTARELGQKIADQFYERYGDVQAFAVNATVQSLDGNKMQKVLDAYVGLYGIYDLILVVDKHGYLVGVNSKDIEGKEVNQKELMKTNFKDSPWFTAVMKGEFTEDKKNAFVGTYFEDFMIDPVMKIGMGEDRLGTSFSAAIKNDKGEVIGVVSNRANKKWFEGALVSSFENEIARHTEDPEITVVNSAGAIISYYHNDEKSKKPEFIRDMDRILKENFVQKHSKAGADFLAKGNGASLSKYEGEDAFDVVGFHKMDEAKWIPAIGWATFVHTDSAQEFAVISAGMKKFYLMLGLLACMALGLAIWVGIAIAKSVSEVTQQLEKSSNDLSDMAIRIAESATQLSGSTTQQAAAIEETVASVDEISAMVDKNADASDKSLEVSSVSRSAAQNGKEKVDQMLKAIEQIDQANGQISNQMTTSNQELSEITKLIKDIGAKTNVINEIVFQTKLLSFNASVEAARAGEYGKGFAVVAEEVGNLAQMSGNAAKEISNLLNESVVKVEGIVHESKTRVENLMNESKEKVAMGSDTAKACDQALTEILTNVESVDGLVSEIAMASKEQSTGIREIAKAFTQMEDATRQSTDVAHTSATAAEGLKKQSGELKKMVGKLARIVNGSEKPKGPNQFVPFEGVPKENTKQNVISLRFPKKNTEKKNEKKKPVEVKAVEKTTAPVEAKAAGSDVTPSSNDPGFGE